jgi:ectoine hydroxylase-related dioxygenase (phytanoyl-CoA dioxygenase family)
MSAPVLSVPTRLAADTGPDAIGAALHAHGYCIIENAIDPGKLAALNTDLDGRFAATPFCEGGFYGRRTKRFGSLLRRSAYADALVRHPTILTASEMVLAPWCDRIALNLTQAVEIHPGALAQFPHRDQDMWQGPKGAVEYLINVMWALSPFAAENGATMIWPASHRTPYHDGGEPTAIEMPPGSALLFLGSTLHGGGANRTDAPRRGIIVSYCLGWLKPFELQWLVYPPEIARTFDPELAALVGYAQHRPNLGNVEGQCPSTLLRPAAPSDYRAAVDALRPDQAEQLEHYIAAQETGAR